MRHISTHFRAMWTLAALDLLLWRRSPMAVASALIPPMGMALLLVVLTATVGRQPVALVVESQGHYANRLAKLIQSDEDAYLLTMTSAPKAAAMLKDQTVAAIITIPPDFDRAVSAHTALLQLTLNNIDIDFADDIRRSVERSVGQFDGLKLGHEGEQTDQNSSAATAAPDMADKEPDEEAEATKGGNEWSVDTPNYYHIAVAEHDLRVTNVDFLHYQVVPVLILLVLSVGLVGTALHCAADGERGTARLLLVSPISRWVLVAGRLLGGAVASLVVLGIALVPGVLTHTISPPGDHWLPLVGLFVSTALCASGMGALLGTGMRGQKNIAMASSLLATYLFFLGGGFTTIAYLPAWLRQISAFNPMRYAIDGMRQALFYPDLTGISTDLMALTGAALASVLLGSLFIVRSWHD
jgi:ABC-2 type transport system permease protein